MDMSFERERHIHKSFLNEGEVRPDRAGTAVALLDLDPRPSAVAARVQEVLEASPFSVGNAMAAAASSEVVSLRSVGAHDAHGVAAEELQCIAALEAPPSRLVHFEHDAVPLIHGLTLTFNKLKFTVFYTACNRRYSSSYTFEL